MTRSFNWNYATAHELGESHIHDTQQEAIAQAKGMFLTDRTVRNTRASERAYREELAKEQSRNPYLMENRHA